ncbi:alkaline phosphatase family protein (plasmid) [Haladaptatus sp. SPP-AMP-3]|uniref:alkaline phosphatase family protein n=1 Tax=Haladaptatus sp. SPP-AMP-3 TaxID=3121295 RepID=UPI003C2F1BD4
MSGKIYTIGLDGVPPRLVEEGIDRGNLPTLEQLKKEGVDGVTRSTRPPLSMMAWSTFATGQNPGNHGIYNFILKNENDHDIEFATSEHLRSNSVPMWEYLDAKGIETGVMNVMPGYPPSKTTGFHISDHITTPNNGQYTYPKELQEEIINQVDAFEIGPPTGYTPGDGADSLSEYIERFFHIEKNRVEVSKRLIKNHPTKVMILIFSAPDIFLHEIGHLLNQDHPKYQKNLAEEYGDSPFKLLEVYDQFIGWLIEQMDEEDMLMVLSDHGHGPVYNAVNLNSWLYQNDYLHLNSNILTIAKKISYNYVFDIVEQVLKSTNLYDRIKLSVARSNSEESKFDFAKFLTISQDDIDWSTTTAFTVAGDGQIFINEDIIEKGRCEEFREELKQDLLSMTNRKQGEKILDAVLYGEDVYDGKFTKSRPDLVCIPKPTYRLKFPQTMKTNQFLVEPQKWFSHTSEAEMNGIFYMWGAAAGDSTNVEISLEDFAPTIFHLLDVSVPNEMDGDVRSDLLTSSRKSRTDTYRGKVQTKRAIRSVVQDIPTSE